MKVPVYEQQVSQRPVGTPYSDVHQDPNAFGASVGQGLEGLGQGLQHVGAEAFDVAKKEKEKVDAAQLMGAYAQFGEWKKQKVYDPQTGYLSKQRENALGDPTVPNAKPMADQYIGDFDAFADKVGKTLGNDDQREAFAKLKDHERESVYQTLSAHERQQHELVVDDRFKSATETAVSNAANGWQEPKQIDAAKTLGDAAAQLHASLKGEDPEVAVRLFRTQLHLAVLDRMTDPDTGDPEVAQKYLQEHGAEMDGKIRGASNIDKTVGTMVAGKRADMSAASIISNAQQTGSLYVDHDLAYKQIAAMPPGVQRDAVEKRVKDLVQQSDDAVVEAGKEKFNEAISKYYGAGKNINSPQLAKVKEWLLDPKNHAAEQWRKLEGEDYRERNMARADKDRTDADQVKDYLAKTTADRAASDIESEYGGRSSKAARDVMRKYQNEAKATVHKGDLVSDHNFQRIADETVQEVPAFRGNKQKATEFKAYMNAWRSKWLSDHKGEEPTWDDTEKQRNHAVLRGDAEGGSWLSPDRFAFEAENRGEKFAPFAPGEQPYKANKTPPPPAAKPAKRDRVLQLSGQGKNAADIAKTLNEEGY